MSNYIEYKKYIQSPKWRKVRKKFFESKLPKDCFVCFRDDQILDLHHRTYARLGHERLTDLVLVCRDCHNEIHKYAKENPTVGLWVATSKVRKRHRKRLEAEKRNRAISDPDDSMLKPSKKIVQSSGAKKLKKIQRRKRRQKARVISDS